MLQVGFDGQMWLVLEGVTSLLFSAAHSASVKFLPAMSRGLASVPAKRGACQWSRRRRIPAVRSPPNRSDQYLRHHLLRCPCLSIDHFLEERFFFLEVSHDRSLDFLGEDAIF